MNQSLTKLVESLRRALRDDVLPELQTDHARSQVAGVLDILGKLEHMLVWSPDALREQLALIEAGYTAIAERAAVAGHVVPMGAALSQSDLIHQADLEQAVRHGELRLGALADWLFNQKSALPADLWRELDALLRGTLRNALASERRLIPRGDFSGMTGTSE